MAGFGVDTDALHQFADRVASVCTDFATLLTGAPPGVVEAGRNDLADALDVFHQHWSDQEGTLLADLVKINKVVHDALTTYVSAEGALTQAATAT